MPNALLDAALGYAKRGWPIFPCRADKTPYTNNGVLDATTDHKKITDYWTKYPRANIGLDCAGAGFLVLDLDPGHSMTELEGNVGKLPKTELRQRTPRGGEHWFFTLDKGEIVAPSASKLASKVDVRSFHSYVLLAPSRTNAGAYAWEAQGKAAFRSDEMVRLSNVAREKHADRDNWIIEADLPENVATAVQWLKTKAKIAIEGQGGDMMAYTTAAHMKGFGISETLAFDLMWEHWNGRCVPPWGADDIDHFEKKIANGYSYNTSPPGKMTTAFKVAEMQVLFKPVEKAPGEGRTLHAGRFTFMDGVAMHHIKPPSWLIEGFLEERGFGMIYGARGVFKTYVALDIGMTLATGGNFPWNGLWKPNARGPVLFSAGEGAQSLPKRKMAWEHTHWDGQNVPELFLQFPVPKMGNEKDLDIFIGGAKALCGDGYALVVIDTLARSMTGLNENDTSDAMVWADGVARIQSELNTAVLVVHHLGYGKDNKTRARGSAVLEDAPDMVVRLDRPDLDNNIVSLTMTKQRNSTEWEKPLFAKLQTVADLKDLAVVAPDPDTVAKAKQMRVVDFTNLSDDEATVLALIDKAIVDELKAAPGKTWSQRDLAEALAMRQDISIPSETLRKKHLTHVRESNDTYANQFKLYNKLRKHWVWHAPN